MGGQGRGLNRQPLCRVSVICESMYGANWVVDEWFEYVSGICESVGVVG